MTRRIVINPLADQDLQEAVAWYEQEQIELGKAFFEAVDAAMSRIQRSPESFAQVHRDIRRMFVQRFPYGIFYRVDADQVTIVAVYHNRRNPRSWQSRS